MKWKKILGLWILLCILIEVLVLSILNQFVFNSSTGNIEKKFIEKISLKNDGMVNIPENSKVINLSYDGKFTTYILMNRLYIVDNATGRATEIQTKEDWKLTIISGYRIGIEY